ncbi:unnamed protein product [Laminaria digitata]
MTVMGEVDLSVFNPIVDRYKKVAKVKKELATTEENSNSRAGNCSKVRNGRMFDEEDEKTGRIAFLYERLCHSTNPIRSMVNDKEMDVLRDVLRLPENVDVAKRTGEEHRSPKEHMGTITRILERMRDENVGVDDIATYNQALGVKDGVSSACLRSQDSLSIPAQSAYIKAGNMECILPPTAKNAPGLKKSENWMVATHVKSKECADDYAVMLVVLRPPMREILRETGRGGDLCATIGPFDCTGRAFDVHRQAALFRFVVHFLGLLRLGTHILRTIYMTMVCMQCVD